MTATERHEYDIVVVGAGGAGAPFAARAAALTGARVLVLEAGPVPRDASGFPPEVLDAAALPTVAGRGAHTSWFPAELAPGTPADIGRGAGAGGCTAVNGAYFVWPRLTDLDRWSAAGNPDWAPERVVPVLRTLEDDTDFGDTGRGGARPGTVVHGSAGPVPVSRARLDRSPVAQAFSEAADDLGFAPVTDLNDPAVAEGHGPLPLNVRDGVRMNTGLTHLLPALREGHITAWGDTTVRTILLDGNRAVGVEAERDGQPVRVHCDEVVLAAGPLATPHLLMLSGIGPATALRRAGVPVAVDSPGVGASFSDHPDLMVTVPLRRPVPNPDRLLFGWALHLSGESTATPGDVEVLPMLRSFGALAGAPDESGDLAVIVALQRPESRGDLTLESADPRRPLRIRHRHLSTEHDRARLRTGLRTTHALLRSGPLGDLLDAGRLEDLLPANDAALDSWMARNLGTAVHTAGTAPMGPPESPGSVTDQQGRVHGVEGLRIVDTSVLPDVPSRGPASTAALVGTHMATLRGTDTRSRSTTPPGGFHHAEATLGLRM
ncbi:MULTISPECIES: mycofactocin system GMC family oxidoreductase MftG [Micrococcaceae]|nr:MULTISPECIES: mycofactocin system GMC family oxidoreductase MftG [Micrococcaceae]MBB5750945.1 putative dehydrogenase (TIGR03970 family) [Micrococcus sp. TA1]HRO30314.1 mycofactocin system GMC family oxidoreductase MftG [Citricoccus sp.]HRO93321.1 mycofactocin system GMC family oxidoreductase MftG [Citricoccus sp.]